MGEKLSEARIKANKKWDEKNKERKNILSNVLRLKASFETMLLMMIWQNYLRLSRIDIIFYIKKLKITTNSYTLIKWRN